MDYFETAKIIIILIIFIIVTILYLLSLFNNIKYKVPQVSTFNSDLEVLKQNL
jgi:beta-lactam-binding protein with PASTA domain